MGTCFLYGNGGGGSELNYRVYASTSTPTNPKTNDIWIESSTAVIRYTFTSSTPSGSSSENGFTYIVSSTCSNTVANDTSKASLNAIKKKGSNGNPCYISLSLTNCRQCIDGAYKQINAYIYKNSSWVQFSTAFSATITVTYPAGSTCTATYGSYTITAPNTTGSWTCTVPYSGDWTISCTNGTETESSTVSITTNGQSTSVTLSYLLPYFYENGNKTVTLQTKGTVTDSGGYITVKTSSDGTGERYPEVYFIIPEIEKYSTISCLISSYSGKTPTVYIRKISTSANVASASPSSSGQTVNIDISSLGLSGDNYYFVLHTETYYTTTNGATGDGYFTAGVVKTNHIWGT